MSATLASYFKYVCRDLQGSAIFKLTYLAEKILKAPVVVINRLFLLNLRMPCLFGSDYILTNSHGAWRVRRGSDFDYTVTPVHEAALEPYFRCRDGIFLDIGAHVGKWSVFVATTQTPRQVFAFEPNPQTFAYLRENLSLNRTHCVVAVNAAASCARGQVFLDLPPAESGMSRVVHRSTERTVMVEAVAVDEFLAEHKVDAGDIELVKIDVEGHELEVLRGMRRLLEQASSRLTIVCEILEESAHVVTVTRFMRDLGFSCLRLPTGIDYVFRRC